MPVTVTDTIVNVTVQTPSTLSVTVTTPGPQGTQGPTGATGATGATGPTGPAGDGFTSTGPFTVTAGGNSDLSGEVTDHTVYNMVDYTIRVIRGTTIFARDEFTIFYRNGAWEMADGFARFVSNASGMTYTVDTATGQINAAANGGSDADLYIKKNPWAV